MTELYWPRILSGRIVTDDGYSDGDGYGYGYGYSRGNGNGTGRGNHD
jgi:hypothetical protein